MITAAELWPVSYTVAGIAAVAAAAGMIMLRLLAARSVATSLTVVAAVTVVATLAGIVVDLAWRCSSSRKDLDVVLAVVAIAGIAGFAVALLLGRRLSAASRLLLSAVQEVGRGGEYRPPRAVLPAELAGLSAALRDAPWPAG